MPRKRYLVEGLALVTYVLFAFSWVAGSMMTKEIMVSFGIEKISDATWATNALTIAKILGNFLAAWVILRLGIKKSFLAASALIVVGGLGVFAGSYSLYVLSRLVMGLGGAMVLVYFNPIAVRYFLPGERAVINGLNTASFNAGALFGTLAAATLLARFGSWQNALLALSACSLGAFLLCALVLEDFPLTAENADADGSAEYTMADGMRDPINWIMPMIYSGLLFSYLAVFSLFPLIPGFAVPVDNLVAVVLAAGLVGSAAGVLFAKRFVRRLPVLRLGGLGMTPSLALMVYAENPALAYAAAFAAGFFIYMPVPAVVTLAQELPNMSAKRVTVIFSMFWSIAYGCSTVYMYIAGLVADVTGNPVMAAVFVIGCSMTFFAGTFLLPETGKAAASPA